MRRKSSKNSGPMSAPWLGAVVTLPPEIEARMQAAPRWHKCSSCKCQILSHAAMCMSCDPAYVQIQPGIFTRTPA